MKKQDWITANQAARHVTGLGQKHPVIVTLCKPIIHRVPNVERRKNVKEHNGLHGIRVIQHHSMGGARTAIIYTCSMFLMFVF